MIPKKVFDEKGRAGKADGFFYMENGLYKATALYRGGRPRRFQTRTYFGHNARALAYWMRNDGWQPPRGLARLCETAPRNSWHKRRGIFGALLRRRGSTSARGER